MNVQIDTQKANQALVSFYCLEPRQGAIINIYHTNMDVKDTKLTGKIIGGKVLNKSLEIAIEDGEMCKSTGTHKIYFSGGIFSTASQVIKMFPDILGISIVKQRRKRSEVIKRT